MENAQGPKGQGTDPPVPGDLDSEHTRAADPQQDRCLIVDAYVLVLQKHGAHTETIEFFTALDWPVQRAVMAEISVVTGKGYSIAPHLLRAIATQCARLCEEPYSAQTIRETVAFVLRMGTVEFDPPKLQRKRPRNPPVDAAAVAEAMDLDPPTTLICDLSDLPSGDKTP